MPVTVDEIGFQERARAIRLLGRLGESVPDGVLHRILQQLAAASAPDQALQSLLAFSTDQPRAFERIIRQLPTLKNLLAIFSSSRFLTQALMSRPEWLTDLTEGNLLHGAHDTRRFRGLLDAEVGDVPVAQLAEALVRFRRKQILRILLRDLNRTATLAETTAELSHLADAILDVAYRRLWAELAAIHGAPAGDCGFSILALGKLGGEEFNYSSDIDLMFVYGASGETTGGIPVSHREFFAKLANRCTALLSTYTPEGLCYRVDLRLRPEGALGEIAISLEAAREYYRRRARDWELQMLIKARVAAGDRAPGQTMLDFVEPLIYSSTLDFSAVEAVSESRLRIQEKAASKKRSGAAVDVKLAAGGIRDIEFLVQCLQRLHGGREPWVRHGGTLLALNRLRDKDLLSAGEYADLSSAYEFLRAIEHRLQVVDDRQTHTLPSAIEELNLLARRMPNNEPGADTSGEKLRQRLARHLERVGQLYDRVVHAQRPPEFSPLAEAMSRAETVPEDPVELKPRTGNPLRFLDRLAPKLAATLRRNRPQRNPEGLARFLEKSQQSPERLAWLNGDPVLASYVVDIFEHSPWLADALQRNPDYLAELRELGKPIRIRKAIADAADDPKSLRQQFQQAIFRILTESLCRRTPIFETLARTTELADAVIESAYRLALEQTVAAQPPASPEYRAEDRMTTIALGRLGMLEFDLASDADLVFVLPDDDEAELPFWTRVAERLIDLLTAYTGDGTLLAVDTRLRPGGRDGSLVQLERTYKDYFAQRAEAWEGIAYMKARAVAGNLDRATAFLTDLQKIDWRRYGQSGRSRKELMKMRLRLEKEQSAVSPLKADRGGYYDIDFSLMYLRLRGAGMFFKALNTPERIDVVERMGHLERADAEFLRDAATFYRAIEHGIRLQTGSSRGRLPTAPARLNQLTAMVTRWTPDHLHDQDLKVELAQIQDRTREYFDRLFSS